MTKTADKEPELDQQIKFLKKISFFNNFDSNELRQFLTVSKWLKFPADSIIIQEGAVEQIFYILVKGRVSVFKNIDEGETMQLTTLKTGDCFGEMALVGETKRTAGVKTTEDSYVLKVEPNIVSTSNAFLQLKFYKRFCEILVTRLVMSNERIGENAESHASPPPEEPPAEQAAEQPAVTAETEKSEPTVVATAPPPEKKVNRILPPAPEKKKWTSPTRLQLQLNIKPLLAINKEPIEKIKALFESDEDINTRLPQLIALDPVLSAKVLQTANSPMFRRTALIYSLPQAVILVGISQIKKAVEESLRKSAQLQFFHGSEELRLRFWRHSVVVARIAQLLKDIIHLNMTADVYMAGLLHDLGKLVVDAIEPTFYPQYLDPDSEFRVDRLKKELHFAGIEHSLPGIWVGEALGLPQVYLDTIRLHHTPEKAHGENHLITAVVHLADIFAIQRGFCLSGTDSEVMAPSESAAWSIIQEHHEPFAEANIYEFIKSFDNELNNIWGEITADLY